mgnify:CR=1 FL=1
MEKSSSLKECPRCGLRNRPGAYQCDFCGWDFKTASDDWMGKINDLESINKDISAPAIDRKIATKIEMTIKRPSEMPARPRKPEKQLEVSPSLELAEEDEVAALPTPVVEEPPAVEEIAVETVPEPLPTAPAEPDAEEIVAEAPREEESGPSPAVEVLPEVSVVEKRSIPIPMIITAGLLVVGGSSYLSALALGASHSIGKELGWVLTIVGSVLLALAARRLYALRGVPKKDDEVVLCPICHEVVSEKDAKCPACGVKFKENPIRE